MKFVSFRRHYLDSFLKEVNFSGKVADIGGEKETARGCFRPPETGVSWIYVNVDEKTSPDILASADRIPAPEGEFDFVKLTEVLEHLKTPKVSLSECHRILKKDGQLIVSVPFLFAVHGDPDDFQRWTPNGLRALLEQVGFTEIAIHPMGGIWATCCDLFEYYCHLQFSELGRLRLPVRILRIFIRRVFLGKLLAWDQTFPYSGLLTTGYFVRAKRG